MGGTPGPCLPPAPKAHFWVLQWAGQAGGRCWGGENGAVWVRAARQRQARPPRAARLGDLRAVFLLEIRPGQITSGAGGRLDRARRCDNCARALQGEEVSPCQPLSVGLTAAQELTGYFVTFQLTMRLYTMYLDTYKPV